MQCDQCTRAMVYHQATRLAMCHYCQDTHPLPDYCPACHKKLLLFGLGIQRIEDELIRKFPLARTARMDSDTMTGAAQFAKLLSDMKAGEVDILLGTQMVAKGLDFPGVTLVGVVSADTSLTISDFRSSERTFQLVVQVAGRAGRAHSGGEVIVQTVHPDEPAIVRAVEHDYDGFARHELPLRQEMKLPPFERMVRLVVRHHQAETVERDCQTLAERLRGLVRPADEVRMIGPLTAPVAKIKNQYRWHILLSCPRPGLIQQRIGDVLDNLARELSSELIADDDPLSLA
jgi:primosomal protein N' (replication factor Y)